MTPIKKGGGTTPHFGQFSVNFPLCRCTAPDRTKISPILKQIIKLHTFLGTGKKGNGNKGNGKKGNGKKGNGKNGNQI